MKGLTVQVPLATVGPASIAVVGPSPMETAVGFPVSPVPVTRIDPLLALLMLGVLVKATDGAMVSMTMFLLAPSELAAPGAARVRVALFPARSLMVPPLRVSAEVDV